jgi:hypothetical protein
MTTSETANMIESKPMTNPEIPAANSPLLEARICPEK